MLTDVKHIPEFVKSLSMILYTRLILNISVRDSSMFEYNSKADCETDGDANNHNHTVV